MGELLYAAKVAHMPSIYAGEKGVYEPMEGMHEEFRQGMRKMGKKMEDLGVETILIVDTHWINTVNFHINAAERHKALYTSDEQPHVIHDYAYDYPGDKGLAVTIAETATAKGAITHAHELKSLHLHYGALVPLRYLNADGKFGVVPLGANVNATHEENFEYGRSIAETIIEFDRRVAFIASGALSHKFWSNDKVMAHRWEVSSEFNRQVDLRVCELLERGHHREVLSMIPVYREACAGETGMADFSMLYGLLGGGGYDLPAVPFAEYCGAAGNGQVLYEFPVPVAVAS